MKTYAPTCLVPVCTTEVASATSAGLCGDHYAQFVQSPFYQRYRDGNDVKKGVALATWWRILERERLNGTGGK